MTKKAAQKEYSQNTSLDDTDKRIAQILQEDFPLHEHPWGEISSKLAISQDELMTRLKRLYSLGVIQKIAPIVDPSKVGLPVATLVAVKVPQNQVDAVAEVINDYANVSHNYEREHEYNVWFTLAASSHQELDTTLAEIAQKAGLRQTDILNLPTQQRFKINVQFQLVGSPALEDFELGRN